MYFFGKIEENLWISEKYFRRCVLVGCALPSCMKKGYKESGAILLRIMLQGRFKWPSAKIMTSS
jgi:hypothetical protein